MSIRNRALVIGLTGPAIQAVGVTWTVLHLLISHVHDPLTARHIVFETPFLLIFVGLLVSIACIPVALEVARASEDDVALPVLGLDPGEEVLSDRSPLAAGE